jgi:D-alanyl-D-alanine carboxypeptidase
MADNFNNNPNNDNSPEPKKRRYILPSSNSEQKPNNTPYPQSLLKKPNNTPTPAELRAKFQKPEPKNNVSISEDKVVESILESVKPILPEETINPTKNSTTKTQEPEVKNYRFEQKQEPLTSPVQEIVKSEVAPIVVEPTISKNSEEIKPIQPEPIPTQNYNQTITQETVKETILKEVQPETISPTQPDIKIDIPKIEPKIDLGLGINTNLLPPEIQTAINEEKIEPNQKQESPERPNTVQELTKKEEPVNPYIKNKKFSLPGTETIDDQFESNSSRIAKELESKFRPKAEPTPVVEEEVITPLQTPKIKIEPAQPLQAIVNPNPVILDKQEVTIDNSESITSENENTPVNSEEPKIITPAEFLKDQEIIKEAKEPKYKLPNQETEAQVDTTASPQVGSAANVILAGFKPLIDLNQDSEEPILPKEEVIEDSKTITKEEKLITSAEFLEEQKENKQEPKYTPKTSKTNDDSIVTPIVIGTATAAVVGSATAQSNTIESTNRVSISNDSPKNQAPKTTSSSDSSTTSERIFKPNKNKVSTDNYSSDPNRYITPSTSYSTRTGQSSDLVEEITTRTSVTTTSTSTDITIESDSIPFNPNRQSITSSTRGKSTKSYKKTGIKAGLAALAAVIGLQAGAAIATGPDSNIFDGVNSDGSAVGTEVQKAGKNFITDENNVGPKYQPTPISEFGQRQGSYDAEGNFTDKSQQSTNPSDSQKPKNPQSKQDQDEIPELNNQDGQNRSRANSGYADEGQYDQDGNLRQNLLTEEQQGPRTLEQRSQEEDNEGNDRSGQTTPDGIPVLSPAQREMDAKNNAPGSIPTQQSPNGGPAIPAPVRNAAPIPQSSDQEDSADMKGKKGSLTDQIVQVFVRIYAKQAIILLILILLTLALLLSMALGAAYILLAGVCSNPGSLQAASVLANANNQGAQSLITTCKAFTAFTGIGCSSKADTYAKNDECIADLLDQGGPTVNLNGLKGDVKADKSIIKDLMKLGHKNFPDDTELILNMIALYPTTGFEGGFGAKTSGGCLGIFKLCAKDYAKAIEGFGEVDEAKFLKDKELQVKVFGAHYKIKKAEIDKQAECVNGFNKKDHTYEYRLLFVLSATGCPDKEDENKVINWEYAEKGQINLKKLGCTEFKKKIQTASIDSTQYWRVANSISSIGSYIGNGLNKFNLNLSITAKAAGTAPINPKDLGYDINKDSGGEANVKQQDELIELLKSGKIKGKFDLPSYIGDIRKQNVQIGKRPYESDDGRPNNMDSRGIHTNVAQFLTLMAAGDPGFSISSLGNNTHNGRGGWHNTWPLLAVDIASHARNGGPDQDSADGKSMESFLKLAAGTKLVLQLLLTGKEEGVDNYQKAVNANIGPDLPLGKEYGKNHFHFSIKANGSAGIGNSAYQVDCPDVTYAKRPSTASTEETRLNKKSLNSAEWEAEKKLFVKTEDEQGDPHRKKIDSSWTVDGSLLGKEKKPMFEKDVGAATEVVYKQAEQSKYLYRNRAKIGEGEEELNGAGPYAMQNRVKKQFDLLLNAMKIDGIKAEHKGGYETNIQTRDKFVAEAQIKCKLRTSPGNKECTAEDIASTKYNDTILQEVLKTNEVPNMSLRSTGLVIEMIDLETPDLKDFEKSTLYKYFTEDSQLNLKRFGFTFTYITDSTQQTSYTVPNQIIYLERDYFDKTKL